MGAFSPPNARGVVFDGTNYDALNLLGARPAEMLGSAHQSGISTLGTGLVTATGSVLDRNGDKPWHPDSPLFWFGTLLAVTFGLIGASTAVRVGPFKASFDAGKST